MFEATGRQREERIGDLVIAADDPLRADVRALLEEHLSFSRSVTPRNQVHALDEEGLLDSDVTLFSARRGGVLVGTAALRRIEVGHAELKSMHTAAAARRQGVGRAMVDHLLSVAAARGHERVSLETGAMDAFGPARALYEEAGFRPCPPFGEYADKPHGVCMTIDLPA
ncbi:MAG: GNAT family N-acetyltransferase [Acidimicrobiales bacterium]